MKVLLETGVWLDKGEGDPCRTLCEEHAYNFEDIKEALQALADARQYRPFPNALIEEDFV